MKTLVVFDTAYGNTEEIARAIGSGVGDNTEVVRARDVKADQLEDLDLLIVGSPTQAGRALPETQTFLKQVASPVVKGMKVASYDTRLSTKWVGVFGFAAGRIGKSLEKMGGNLVAPPAPFFVTGKNGPLKEGELERATGWGKKISV